MQYEFIPLLIYFLTKQSLKFEIHHRAPLVQVRWSLHNYKCLWGVEGKSRDSNL